MNKLDYDGILRKQVLNYCNDVPVLIDGFQTGKRELRFPSDNALYNIEKVLITGSGDCMAAAWILQTVFDDFLKPGGVRCEAYTPMELSRFTELTPNDSTTLIIVLSVWGFPARLVEVLERAAKYHIPSIAITEKDNSPVGLAADYALKVHNSTIALESKSGCCTYLGMLISASLFAAHLSGLKGIRPPESVNVLADLLKIHAEKVQKEIDRIDEQAFEIANSWKDTVEGVIAVGDGTDYASALFFPAKLIESAGIFGGFTDSRQWLDSQQYIGRPNKTGVVIYARQTSPAREAQEKAIEAAARKGFSTLVISDYPCPVKDKYPSVNTIVLPAAPVEQDYIGSFFNHLPADLLASYLCELWGGSYFRSAVIEDTEYGVNHKEGSTLWAKPGINTLQSSRHVLI